MSTTKTQQKFVTDRGFPYPTPFSEILFSVYIRTQDIKVFAIEVKNKKKLYLRYKK